MLLQSSLVPISSDLFNPFFDKIYGLLHHYQMDESTFVCRGVSSDFSMKFIFANRIASDGTPRSAASQFACVS